MEKTKNRIRNKGKDKLTQQNTMACNNRLCNSYQHGMMDWLGEEVGALYRKVDDQKEQLQEQNARINQLNARNIQLSETVEQQGDMLEQFQLANQELLRKCIRTTLQKRAMVREHAEDLQRLKEQILLHKQENQALAKALRAAPMHQWISKKRKTD